MAKSKLRTIYDALELTSVFFGVRKKSLLKAFFDYVEAEESKKRLAYANFVAEIYEGGGDLTALTKKLLFEDENVYVKGIAKGEKIPFFIGDALQRELTAFSLFAGLTPRDFALDLGVSEKEIPAFESQEENLQKAYATRMQGIHKYGYGVFSAYGMFRLNDEKEIVPIASADKISLSTFIGYEDERNQIIENTKALIENRPTANALLCGDAGTGKSSTVKAVANAFFGEGVRLIELRKDQLRYLPRVMGKISGNPLKFIIFIDDLAFNKSDDNFSMLKAVLEGSASAKADNAVIYATSNRRHIIKESFSDRDGDDVHRNDTLQETLSLSERFGLVVTYSKPSKALYLDIVHQLAVKKGVKMANAELDIKAEAFALKKGSRSARCAEQFIDSLL